MSFIDSLSTIKNYEHEIITTINRNKITIIKGPTGCGKSTYIPFLLQKYKVAVIEPRRIAVLSLFNTLTEIMDVGYKVRFSKKNTKANVIFMTDGTFINELISKKYSMDYDFIILDEVHERNIRIDLIMAMIGRIKTRAHFIMMSATVDCQLYMKYFNAQLISIKGLSHKAEIIYLNQPTEDYLVQSFITVKEIVSREKDKKQIMKEIDDIFMNESLKSNKDILIFLPGEEDIHEVDEMIEILPDVKVYKIFASLSDSEQNKIFEDSDKIKVILSTNICETSLTIPGIKYVIDTGLHKEKIYKGISYFGVKQIGRDSADQRLGRCNRTENGICYRLYTENSYKKMRYSIPEILKSDLSFILLFLLHHGIEIKKFEFLTFPSKKNIILSLEYLLQIKAININDDKINISDYGRILLKYPLDINHAHFYRCCLNYKVEKLGAVIISFLTQENCNFLDSNTNRKKSDLDVLINLFKEYNETDQKQNFCIVKNINIKYMEISVMVYKQLQTDTVSIDYSQVHELKKAFCLAFNYNKSIKIDKNVYKNIELDVEVGIHPSNYYYKRNPDSIVYVNIWSTNRNYGRIIESCES